MTNERMDLVVLMPDDRKRERMVTGIMRRASSELARRASIEVSPIAILSDWLRPALAAAAVIALVCVPLLRPDDPAPIEPGSGYTDALDVPAPMNEWLISGRAPTVADLMIAMDRE